MDHKTLLVGSTKEVPLGAKRTMRLQLLETCATLNKLREPVLGADFAASSNE
jgi:hypothetical protein